MGNDAGAAVGFGWAVRTGPWAEKRENRGRAVRPRLAASSTVDAIIMRRPCRPGGGGSEQRAALHADLRNTMTLLIH